jgi:hypothetical protein
MFLRLASVLFDTIKLWKTSNFYLWVCFYGYALFLAPHLFRWASAMWISPAGVIIHHL